MHFCLSKDWDNLKWNKLWTVFLIRRALQNIIKLFSTEMIYNSFEGKKHQSNKIFFCPQFFKGFFFIIVINPIIKFHNFVIYQLLFHVLVAGGRKHRWRQSVKWFLQELKVFLSCIWVNLIGKKFLEGGFYFLTVCWVIESKILQSWDCIKIP